MIFHIGSLDWWIFIYSPSLFLSLGFIIGRKRWSDWNNLAKFFPMLVMVFLGLMRKIFNAVPMDSSVYFSILYFGCLWILIANLRNPGLAVFSFGGMLNSVAALANGGKMPVLGTQEFSQFHQPMNSLTKISWACDYIETPTGLYMMSPGDLIIIIGAVIFFMSEVRALLIQEKSSEKN